MAVPLLGPWPTLAINDFAGGYGSARTQPAIWQPCNTADLPANAPTTDAHGQVHHGAVKGDLIFDKSEGKYKQFNGLFWEDVGSPGGVSFDTVSLFDNFVKRPLPYGSYFSNPAPNVAAHHATNTDWLLVGTNVTVSLVTPTQGAFYNTSNRAFTLGTKNGGAQNDQAILVPHNGLASQDAYYSQWNYLVTFPELCLQFDIGVSLPAITALTVWAGLRGTYVANPPAPPAPFNTTTDNNKALFWFNPTTSANWQFTYSIAGSHTTVNTGVAVAANTLYHLSIRTDASRIGRAYINGTLVATTTALTSGQQLGRPQFGVQTNDAGGAQKYLQVAGISLTGKLYGITVP